MDVIVAGRQRGKTTQLVRRAAAEHLYIVCATRAEAHRVYREASGQGIAIPYPITWDEFVSRRYYPPGVNGFLIDNLDMCVQSMTPVPVKAVTLNDDSDVPAVEGATWT